MSETKTSTSLVDSSMLYFLAFVTVFLAVYTYGRKFMRMAQLASKIPGPNVQTTGAAVIKTFNAEPFELYKLALSLQKNFPDIAKVWFGPKLTIFLYHPADIELILGSNVHIDKSAEYSVFHPWFGNGLLVSTGPKWKHHRKMIAPTFHQSILKTFVPKFFENSLKVCEKMKREEGKNFDCHEYMSGTTVDILLETAMGYNAPRTEETGYNYAMAVMKLCDILHRRHYKFWLRPTYFFNKSVLALEHSKLLKVIMSLTTKVVHNKRIEILKKGVDSIESTFEKVEPMDKTDKPKAETVTGYNYGTAVRDDLDDNDENDIGEKKRLAFLEQLTVNSQRQDVDFTEQEVLDQVNTIMFEGHDTTAAGSSFALCMMGIHKDIQQKCMQEIDEIFQGSDRECTFADTLDMRYLERVIMETLRMYPPVPLIARQLQEEVPLRSGKYSLPVGATVVVVQAVLHRRPEIFPNPDVFNPDNFVPEKCQDRHYYSYIPFSAGPRSCVGRKFAMLKLKVLLSTILRKYRVHCDMKEEDFKLQADIILKIADGFNIRLENRKDIPCA